MLEMVRAGEDGDGFGFVRCVSRGSAVQAVITSLQETVGISG